MNHLHQKHILLGITGSIAAYKSADLVRRLREAGAEVRVVMTRSATGFVTPLTFQALSGNPVHTDLLDATAEAAMGHIELARWADILLIAPASANFIARLTNGMADDLLSAICLATTAPVALAPAMNQQMWQHPATRENILTLQQRQVKLFGPAAGSQACGETGPGRMLEPEELLTLTSEFFSSGLLAGRHVMVTAGPTLEDIDPVRFIGNRSSGRMGFAIAAAAQEAGARVTLISGPVHLPTPRGIRRLDVRSAHDMHEAVINHLEGVDIFIATAAVADYRPYTLAPEKIKKQHDTLHLDLIRNPDILRAVATMPGGPYTVGFAAETHNLAQYAKEKLAEKKLDMICANVVGGEQGGFESEQNALHLFWKDGDRLLPLTDKPRLARQLIEIIAAQYMKTVPPTRVKIT
ncbi:MAG: phosphopantothenoylcysteine decarboxylase [Gammaproteobacteria bacterium RBG_16_57_12]|nr:MAG: phosphopantothenoylcysteine decarboxylase [Gammaproteobacteria bacterium RBG_16_57_12]